MDVTIAVATFGDPKWIELAQRAIASARDQCVPVIHVHGQTLASARNSALEQVDTEYVVHLDADDELEAGYIAALAAGTADLRVPSVRYIRGGRDHAPYVPRVAGHRHDCEPDCLRSGNYIVIGAMVRTALLREVGGWNEFQWSEDWDAWLRCWRAGASIETIPAAVYRAHVRADSRNRAPSREFRLAQHEAIHRANFPDLYAA